VFPAFDATIQAIASDAGSAAGANPVISCFDELWAYTSERSRRLFDEMNVPPTRKIAARLTVSYAGYQGESVLLEELYKRGLEQPKLGEDLHGGDGLLMFWSGKPVAPWQDEAWAQAMRRERASAFQRQYLNEFATSATTFIDMGRWDDCVDDRLSPVPVDLFMKAWVGLDGSVKYDQTALVAVTFDIKSKRVRLLNHRAFQPTPQDPINFEETVEKTLRDWCRQYQVKQIAYDPFQMQAVAQRLIRDRLPMQEFPQSQSNLTAVSQCLFELINGGNLWLYPDPAMRRAVAQTVAKETPRGWRISKQSSAHKIDLVAALSFACFTCIEAQKGPNFSLQEMLANEREQPPGEAALTDAERNHRWRQQQLAAYMLRAAGAPRGW
jgi:phage terminase large subunit-like protein